MSTDLVLRDDGLAPEVIGSAYDLAAKVAKTEFVPSALRGKPDAIMACILMGREIGVGPMQSLSKIHVVDGRPAMAAELMRARALEHGHDIWIEEKSSTRVTVAGKRLGSEHVSKVTWTMDDAKRAGIAGKNNWRKYPRAMLTARATAELCRDVFADCLGGVSYSVEELDDGGFEDTTAEGEPIKAEPAKKTTKKGTVRRRSPQRGTAQPAASGPPLPHELDDDHVVDAELVEEDDDQDDGLEQMTVAKLKLMCHRADLPVSGTKAELIARLRGEEDDDGVEDAELVDDDRDADFSESSRDTDEDPADDDQAASATAEEVAPEPDASASGEPASGAAPPPPDDDDEERRPFDRDGAQKAFHARLRDLDLDYESQVKPWMLAKLQASLSGVDDDSLRKLLDAMERRGDDFARAVREHAASVTTAAEDDEPGEITGDTKPPEDDPGRSLAERARAHADGSDIDALQDRIREAFRVLAVHDEPTYRGGWERLDRIVDGRASSTDWSGASGSQLRALATDLERRVGELEAEGVVR